MFVGCGPGRAAPAMENVAAGCYLGRRSDLSTHGATSRRRTGTGQGPTSIRLCAGTGAHRRQQ